MEDKHDNQPPTIEELRACSWRSILASCAKKDCSSYSSLFLREAETAKAAGNIIESRALRFLGHLTSMAFRLDEPAAPLVPYLRFGVFRSAALEDFEEAQLSLLKDIHADIDEPELKARVCDVLWLRARDRFAGEEAARAYLLSAEILEHPEHWNACVVRFERAAQLAASLRRLDLLAEAVDKIEATLRRHAGSDPFYLSANLMKLLLTHKRGDPAECAAFAENAAAAAESSGDYDRATTYLEIKAQWQKRGNDTPGANDTCKRIGENWAKVAQMNFSGSPPDFSAAVIHAQRALEALQKLPGTKDRRREIHTMLLRYQQAALGDLKRFEVTQDITHLVKRAESLVSGQDPRAAIFKLALSYRPIPPQELRAGVEAQARSHPVNYLFSSVVLTNQGRVAARHGALLGGTQEETEAAIEAEMCRSLTMRHSLISQALIEPARKKIIFEHGIREADFYRFVSASPFVPEGREILYAKGLWAGLYGDFITSTHILVPQIEHSIRVLLSERAGALTSNLKSNGSQDELDLNTTLRMREIDQVLGEGLAFDLRTLLIERFGSNLRNRFAHGLMHQLEFMTHEDAYLWWVCLYLCLAPLAIPPQDQES